MAYYRGGEREKVFKKGTPMSHAHKTKVLFVYIHNSARSQMAEAFLRALGGEEFEAESAGFEPGILNPLAVSTMQEVGIDISHHTPPRVFLSFSSRANATTM